MSIVSYILRRFDPKINETKMARLKKQARHFYIKQHLIRSIFYAIHFFLNYDMQLLEMIKNIETQTDWDRIEKSNEQSLRDKKLKRSDIDGDDNGDDASPAVSAPVPVP